MATEFYKCMNGLNPTYLQDIVTTRNTEYTLKKTKLNQYNSLNVRRTHGIHSFRYNE